MIETPRIEILGIQQKEVVKRDEKYTFFSGELKAIINEEELNYVFTGYAEEGLLKEALDALKKSFTNKPPVLLKMTPFAAIDGIKYYIYYERVKN